MRLSVEPRRTVATPGTPTMLGVVIANGSDVISGYVLRVLGADPSWVEIEDPFGYDANDLPLDATGETIAADTAAIARTRD